MEILDEIQLFSQELQRCVVPEALEELGRATESFEIEGRVRVDGDILALIY